MQQAVHRLLMMTELCTIDPRFIIILESYRKILIDKLLVVKFGTSRLSLNVMHRGGLGVLGARFCHLVILAD